MKKIKVFIVIIISITTLTYSFKDNSNNMKISANEILGNKDYPAISYGGYRKISRDLQPTIDEIKEDLKILSAVDIEFYELIMFILSMHQMCLKQSKSSKTRMKVSRCI